MFHGLFIYLFFFFGVSLAAGGGTLTLTRRSVNLNFSALVDSLSFLRDIRYQTRVFFLRSAMQFAFLNSVFFTAWQIINI